MQFKKKEVFVGNLRVLVDEKTENFLKAKVPTEVWENEGHRFEKFPDGHIEVETIYEHITRMLREANIPVKES